MLLSEVILGGDETMGASSIIGKKVPFVSVRDSLVW